MSEKASCKVCGSYTSSIYRTGRCPNGCLGGQHDYEPGAFGFCGASLTIGILTGKHTGGRTLRAVEVADCGMAKADRIHWVHRKDVEASW